jgi:RHS repeat-associated protein
LRYNLNTYNSLVFNYLPDLKSSCLGNVRVTFKKGITNTLDVLNRTDYYAFGMGMFGRSSGNEYAFGNNGQRAENELFEGAYSAEFWMYDSRLGRRWEIDPLYYANQSPYVTFNNNPILFSDPLGLEAQDQLPVKPSFLTDDNSGGGNANHKQGKGPNGQKVQLPLSANIKYFTSDKFRIPASNKVANTPVGTIKSFQVLTNSEFIQGHGWVNLYNEFEAYFSSETGDFIGYYDLDKNLHYTPEKIFEKQEEAFEYFWSSSIQNKTENGMYILKSGLFIVTPNSNNSAGSTASVLDYNIITKEGRSYLHYNGKWEEILAVGHTHPVYM